MKTKSKSTRKPSPSQISEVVRDTQQLFPMREAVDLLLTIPEIAEVYTRADIELALDDQGWTSFTGTRNMAEMLPQVRYEVVNKCRLYWLKDPLAKQAVRLWTDYCLGNGITFSATDDEAAQAKLEAFVGDRRNKRIMNAAGQQKSSKQLLIDGDVFFAIFKGNSGKKYIRKIDPQQITDLITDPEDDERVLAYRRKTAADKILYYADASIDDADRALAESMTDPQDKSKKIKLERDVIVYHVAFDAIGKRGNGLLSCVVDWSREHRRFMEARVAITQALSKFAHKATIKGGQQVLNSIKSRLESTIAQTGLSGGTERNPVTAPGSTWLQNAGMELTAMPRATGGAEAKDDADSLKLMVAAGTNVMLHYFGDPSTGNLATATAMELPMLKSFNGYQQLWIDAWKDIFAIVLEEDPDGEQIDIDVELPPILAEDLQKLGTFVGSLVAAFPEAKTPEILQMLLVAMGVGDLEDVMKKIEKNKLEIEAKQAKQDKLMMSQPMNPKQAAASIKATENLAEAFTRLADKL